MTERELFGIALFDRKLLRTLESLWVGPLLPENLNSIEQAIRAFLTHPKLSVSRMSGRSFDGIQFDAEGNPAVNPTDYFTPLEDTCLQFAFSRRSKEEPYCKLEQGEKNFLVSNVSDELRRRSQSIFPNWIKTEGQAFEFIDRWYYGYTLKQCEQFAKDVHENKFSVWSDCYKTFNKSDPDSHAISYVLSYMGSTSDAEYLVGCHRSGYTIYGSNPIIDICSEHLFSKWPNHLFNSLDRQFRKESDLLRGTGLGVTLPPMTALVLSRASNRDCIPQTLYELRDEYKSSRDKLWGLLFEMWYSKSFREQVKILNALTEAADSIFTAAFPERFDALSLGISATDMLSGQFSSTLSNIRNQLKPSARVAAVSFAAKISGDLRTHLLNCREIISTHFTEFEKEEFGAE